MSDTSFPNHPGPFVRARGQGEPDSESLPPIASDLGFLEIQGSVVYFGPVPAGAVEGSQSYVGLRPDYWYIAVDGDVPENERATVGDDGHLLTFTPIGA